MKRKITFALCIVFLIGGLSTLHFISDASNQSAETTTEQITRPSDIFFVLEDDHKINLVQAEADSHYLQGNRTFYPAKGAIDGITDNHFKRWMSDNKTATHYIEVSLDEKHAINIIKTFFGRTGRYNYPQKQYSLQYLSGNDWVTILERSDNSNPTPVDNFGYVVTDKVRWETNNSNYVRMYEIEVFGKKVASEITVEEQQAKGTIIADLGASDLDVDDRFTYTLISGAGDYDNSNFSIQGNKLKIASLLDYDEKINYSIRVQVKDSQDNTFEKALKIGLIDIPAPTDVHFIAENTKLKLIHAEADSVYVQGNGKSNYLAPSVIDGITNDHFSRWMSGNDTTPHFIELTLDKEREINEIRTYFGKNGVYNYPQKSYTLKYWDGSQWVTIVERDNNTNPTPVDTFDYITTKKLRWETSNSNFVRMYEFEVYGKSETHELTIREGIPGESYIAKLGTIDVEPNDTFTYLLVEGKGDYDNGYFSIEGDSLKTNSPLDYESKNSFNIRVRVIDSHGYEFEQNLKIQLTN